MAKHASVAFGLKAWCRVLACSVVAIAAASAQTTGSKLSKFYSSSSTTVGSTVTLMFAVNPGAAATNVKVTDFLPSNLAVANPNGVVNGCGGTIIAAPGSFSVTGMFPSVSATPCTFAVNVTAVVPGTTTNTATGTSDQGSLGTATAPLVITSGTTSGLTANPASGLFNAQAGSAAVSQNFAISNASSVTWVGVPIDPPSTTGGVSRIFRITNIRANASGLKEISVPSQGNGSTVVTVTADPTGLVPGTYTSTLNFTALGASNPVLTVPLNLVVSANPTLTATPSSLTFDLALGSTATATGILAVVSTGSAIAFTVSSTTSSGTNWLSVSPDKGTAAANAPAGLVVTANPSGLATGTYTGTVTVTGSNTAVTVPVNLVIAADTLKASPSSLTYIYQAGSSAAPPSQEIVVDSTSGTPLPVTVLGTSPNWLMVTPTAGATPLTIAVAVNTTLLPSTLGTYTGSITLSSGSGTTGSTTSSPVTITVTDTQVVNVLNSASFQSGAVAPGELVAAFAPKNGIIGPSMPVGLTLTSNGMVSTNLGNTQVYFDGIPAPLIYVSATQINAIVPYQVAGKATTRITTQFNGNITGEANLPVVPAAPAFFTLNGSGTGQVAALNHDGTVNSESNPASGGTTVEFFLTGEGLLNPSVPTGSVTSATGPTFPTPIVPFTLKIGGQQAVMKYFGEAPGLVSGVLQVNAVLPTGLTAGPQPLDLESLSLANLIDYSIQHATVWYK